MRHEKSTKGEKERSYARPNTFTLANEFDHIPATFTSSFSYFLLVSPDFEALEGGPIDLNDGKNFTTMEWLMVFVKVPL